MAADNQACFALNSHRLEVTILVSAQGARYEDTPWRRRGPRRWGQRQYLGSKQYYPDFLLFQKHGDDFVVRDNLEDLVAGINVLA